VKEMRTSNPRSCWNNVTNDSLALQAVVAMNLMALLMCNGHLDSLVEEINSFFASVASDLQPLIISLMIIH
jgi:hypothetical protein